jgi:gag-polypeptide of LTR copia-type
MENDVMREFRQYEVAKEMWLALKQKFDGTSVTKLRQLTIKFDTYKKRPNHSMRQHLREMSNMISELKDAGHILTDEQQVQAVIRSLPYIWEHMKVNLTHNERIKTLNDAVRHLELEEDRIEASKPQETETTVHLAGSSSHGGQGQKRKSNDGKGKGKQEKV